MFFCIFVAIVRTLASASRISCSGEVVTEDSDAEVIIHKLHSSPGTANGVMTFAALGEKPRSSARQFDMVRVLAAFGGGLHSLKLYSYVQVDYCALFMRNAFVLIAISVFLCVERKATIPSG